MTIHLSKTKTATIDPKKDFVMDNGVCYQIIYHDRSEYGDNRHKIIAKAKFKEWVKSGKLVFSHYQKTRWASKKNDGILKMYKFN